MKILATDRSKDMEHFWLTIHRTKAENLDYERERRAKTNFLKQAIPYQRALCELEIAMPIGFIQNSNGTLTKIEHYNWPKWAITRKKLLIECLNLIQNRCFEAEGLKIIG